MRQIIIQLDDRTADELEKVAPAANHLRSAFIRRAIARALQDVVEARTRAAYTKWPDAPPRFDPAEWAPEAEAIHPPKRRARRRAKKR